MYTSEIHAKDNLGVYFENFTMEFISKYGDMDSEDNDSDSNEKNEHSSVTVADQVNDNSKVGDSIAIYENSSSVAKQIKSPNFYSTRICYSCGKSIIKMSQYFMRIHPNESEVEKYINDINDMIDICDIYNYINFGKFA